MSSLKINWMRSGKYEPTMISNDDPNLNFDFAQDTWQQQTAYFYKVVELNDTFMILEIRMKKGLTNSGGNDRWNEVADKPIRLCLFKKVLGR